MDVTRPYTFIRFGAITKPYQFIRFGTPGAAQTPKTDPKKSGQTAFRYPVFLFVAQAWYVE